MPSEGEAMEVFSPTGGPPPAPPPPPAAHFEPPFRLRTISPPGQPWETAAPPPVLHLPPRHFPPPELSPPGAPWDVQPPGGEVLPPPGGQRRSARLARQLPTYFRETFSSETESVASTRSRDPDYRPSRSEPEASDSSGAAPAATTATSSSRPRRLAAATTRMVQRLTGAVTRRPQAGSDGGPEGGEEIQQQTLVSVPPLAPPAPARVAREDDSFLRELLEATTVAQGLPQRPQGRGPADGAVVHDGANRTAAELAFAAAEARLFDDDVEMEPRPQSAASNQAPPGRARRTSGRARDPSTVRAHARRDAGDVRARSREAALEARRGGLDLQQEDSAGEQVPETQPPEPPANK